MEKGFTIIELIVVIAIFLFIIGSALGIFISIVENQRKILSEQQLLSQISYIEEYLSKALRMASVDDTGEKCFGESKYAGFIYLLTRYDNASGSFRGIKFYNRSSDSCQEIFLDNAVYGDASSPLVLKELKNNPAPETAVSITSTALNIESVAFSVNGYSVAPLTTSFCHDDIPNSCGAANTDTVQPRVTILLNVSANNGAVARKIQTTISQRNLNANYGQR